jgi:hypothetical protein
MILSISEQFDRAHKSNLILSLQIQSRNIKLLNLAKSLVEDLLLSLSFSAPHIFELAHSLSLELVVLNYFCYIVVFLSSYIYLVKKLKLHCKHFHYQHIDTP